MHNTLTLTNVALSGVLAAGIVAAFAWPSPSDSGERSTSDPADRTPNRCAWPRRWS